MGGRVNMQKLHTERPQAWNQTDLQGFTWLMCDLQFLSMNDEGWSHTVDPRCLS